MPSIAIDILRQVQEDCRLRLGISASLKTEQAILEETLKQAEIRQSQTKREVEYIRSGIFIYPSLTEELRWQRTRDVIRRVKPGMEKIRCSWKSLHGKQPQSRLLFVKNIFLLTRKRQGYVIISSLARRSN